MHSYAPGDNNDNEGADYSATPQRNDITYSQEW